MDHDKPDHRSFVLGMITAFSECVAGGCKRLALSPPLTRKAFEELAGQAYEIIDRHGLLHAHEANGDLPETMRFDWILIAAKQETLDRYHALRARRFSPAVSLVPFEELLSYDEKESVRTGYDAYRDFFPAGEDDLEKDDQKRKQMNREMCMIEELLEKPCWVIDFLPRRVPAEGGGQFFRVEPLWLREPRLSALRRRFADILLKLNCYEEMDVGALEEDCFTRNPEPEALADWAGQNRRDLCVLLPGRNALITLNRDDTHMTVYNPPPDLLSLIGQLAAAEGLFVWQAEGNGGEA